MCTQRLVRSLVTWGARCRKAARRDLLGACSAMGASTRPNVVIPMLTPMFELAPEQHLKDKDKRWAAYHRFYTDMRWGYAPNYHISLDSGALGIEDGLVLVDYQDDMVVIADSIVDWLKIPADWFEEIYQERGSQCVV